MPATGPGTIYQRDPIKASQKQLAAMEFREDVKGEKYVEGKPYRDRNYPDALFFWVAYPKGSDTKGEWQMGPLEGEGK